MKAHVEDSSERDDQDISPFYFLTPEVSGPDIMFFLQIKGVLYLVFFQLKLRHVLQTTDAEQALVTISGRAVQEKLNKEQVRQQKEQQRRQRKQSQREATCTESGEQQPPRLQDFCPTGMSISMVITYPANVVRFQVVRPDPRPELAGLTRVSIEVDDNNFSQIFSERHMKFLDRLKLKRNGEYEHGSDRSKKTKGEM